MVNHASIPDRMGSTVKVTDGRQPIDWYWPLFCEIPCDPDRDPCEGETVWRVRTLEGELYVCDSHFGRQYKNLLPCNVDRLR